MNESALRTAKVRDISNYSVSVPQIDWREMLFAIRDCTGWNDQVISKKSGIGYGSIASLKNDAWANPNFSTGSKLLRMFLDLTDRDVPYLQS